MFYIIQRMTLQKTQPSEKRRTSVQNFSRPPLKHWHTGGRALNKRTEHSTERTRDKEKKAHTRIIWRKIVREAQKKKKKNVERKKKRMKYSNNNNKWAGIEFCFVLFHSVFCSVLDTMTNAFWFRKLHDYFAELITLFIRIAEERQR